MILITVVDDDNGLTFNHRRQSKDRMLRQHILQMVEGKTLWMDSYSVRQFEELPQDGAKVDDDYFAKAAPGDFCFMERMPDSFVRVALSSLSCFAGTAGILVTLILRLYRSRRHGYWF